MAEDIGIQVGNAGVDSQRGWFVGHFMDEKFGLQRNNDVEIKWGVQPAGWSRPDWAPSDVRMTISILISGKFEIEFRDKTVTLAKQGDFVMWGEGREHTARTLGNKDAVILTVRWPSNAELAK